MYYHGILISPTEDNEVIAEYIKPYLIDIGMVFTDIIIRHPRKRQDMLRLLERKYLSHMF